MVQSLPAVGAARPQIDLLHPARTAPIEAFLDRLWEAGGTDLLLVAGAPPLLRIDGRLVPYDDATPLVPAELDRVVGEVLGDELQPTFDFEGDVDFSLSWRGRALVRGNAFRQQGSSALALRLVPVEIPTFDDLGLPPAVRDLADLPHGLVLATGPP